MFSINILTDQLHPVDPLDSRLIGRVRSLDQSPCSTDQAVTYETKRLGEMCGTKSRLITIAISDNN